MVSYSLRLTLSLPAKKGKDLYNFKVLISKTVGPLSFLFRRKGGKFKMKVYWQLAPTVQSKDLVSSIQKL
jgi:hypothetical protein